MKPIFPALLLTAILGGHSSAGETLATIRLYNPTSYRGSILTEVPAGRIAAPGLIDWARARLMVGDEEIPFAIRAGRAHWRAGLTPPGHAPAAEDLLVFWRAVAPGKWARVDVVAGARRQESIVARTDGAIRIVYDNVEVVLNESSGLLTTLRLHGNSILDGPMTALSHTVGAEGYVLSGPVGPGYLPHQVAFEKNAGHPFSARLAFLESTETMTTIKKHGTLHGPGGGLPLVAGNPVVPFRGGGFGGGNFEVDFPYASDEEWEGVFDRLLDSGMNIFWCLGMWGNWKLPVEYTYMPELRSDSPDAYDESSGALFSELADQRAHGLKLMKYLQDRGGHVYLWLPIGCVPTTFMERYPEAIMAGSITQFWGRPKGTPCFTHPKYRAYLDAFLRELTETYPLDGIVLVRDDNGGICNCDRCQAYVAAARTKSPVWEQYLMIYDWLRGHGFEGTIGVYPYHDTYQPALEAHLPADLFLGGHGASTPILVRDHKLVGHMPDTWLDNLYANFRLPPSPRMRRLLSDRCTFWIGGAYRGTELPWEAIGYFGWEPTATPNSLRFQWGVETFGRENGLAFVGVNDAYEQLWEINARFMLPAAWLKLTPAERNGVQAEAMALLASYGRRLAALKRAVPEQAHARWFGHMELFTPFLEYHLRRLRNFSEIHDIVQKHQTKVENGVPLPASERAALLAKWAEVYDWAETFGTALHNTPGDMLSHCRNFALPNKEWVSGWDAWLDPQLVRPQFAGRLTIAPVAHKAGEPFTLRVEMVNTGVCPWIERAVHRFELSGASEQLGLPARWILRGDPVAPGDRRMVELMGNAPAESGQGQIILKLYNTSRVPAPIAETTLSVEWN